MVHLLFQNQYALFTLIVSALIISLTFHEYGHAITAKLYGDDTAKKAGRLTLNPIAHIDPFGLLMVILIGIGFAKPVPTNPANYNSRWAILWVAAAGPAMNLILAIVTINLYVVGLNNGWALFSGEGANFFFTYLAIINLMLMLFNLIPIAPLDGHYILPYFLPRRLAIPYRYYNQRYGFYVLISLILLNFAGVPVFKNILAMGNYLIPYLLFV